MSDKLKILVVDDEPDAVNYLTAIFQDNGYDTITANNGKQALEVAISQMPALITLDLSMPEESGVRAYRNIKSDPSLKKIPVIIITAVGDSMKKFIDKLKVIPEPEGFMSKPINPDELLKMTADILSK
ncbi:MAG: response regulator [Desulfobacterales bacterium CG23_combo_of_CG06-09_8_20_14_all_51_8]|nr:MAG: response regulator [Desulfobacterales bacterium CG23_combo_of_CG06-09_8_20_14_all_51_8]